MNKFKSSFVIFSLFFATSIFVFAEIQADAKKVLAVCSLPDRQFVEDLIAKNLHLSGEEKILAISNAFLNKEAWWEQRVPPAEISGEELKEEILTVNLNTLDCVRYMELVVAIAKSKNWDEFSENLAKTRYKNAQVSTSNRLHFPSIDWIPENIKTGNFIDITTDVAKSLGGVSKYLAVTPKITIDKEKFFKVIYPEYLKEFTDTFKKSEERIVEDVSLNYIDFYSMWTPSTASDEEKKIFEENESKAFSAMMKIHHWLYNTPENATKDEISQKIARYKELKSQLDKMRREFRLMGASLKKEFIDALPAISVATLVRPTHSIKVKETFVTHMLVTHHGFIVKKQGKLFFRHTSTKYKQRIVDVPFEEYMSNFLASGSNYDVVTNRRSTWRGLHFMAFAQ